MVSNKIPFLSVWLGRFVAQQQRWCAKFDRRLPLKFKTDGNADFLRSIVPTYVKPGSLVYDIGGGKTPCLDASTKAKLALTVVGLDISETELRTAPPGSYDRTVTADIQSYRGCGDTDLVICQALLEHIPNTAAAFESMATILKPGGLVLLFVPSRNAAYARLNLLLPEAAKRALLFTLFPAARRQQGFPCFYDRCTPTQFKEMAFRCGLEVVEERFYYMSDYFSCFFPAFLAWRLWLLAGYPLLGEHIAETFCLVLKRVAAHN